MKKEAAAAKAAEGGAGDGGAAAGDAGAAGGGAAAGDAGGAAAGRRLTRADELFLNDMFIASGEEKEFNYNFFRGRRLALTPTESGALTTLNTAEGLNLVEGSSSAGNVFGMMIFYAV